jgi:hypothetical protein
VRATMSSQVPSQSLALCLAPGRPCSWARRILAVTSALVAPRRCSLRRRPVPGSGPRSTMASQRPSAERNTVPSPAARRLTMHTLLGINTLASPRNASMASTGTRRAAPILTLPKRPERTSSCTVEVPRDSALAAWGTVSSRGGGSGAAGGSTASRSSTLLTRPRASDASARAARASATRSVPSGPPRPAGTTLRRDLGVFFHAPMWGGTSPYPRVATACCAWLPLWLPAGRLKSRPLSGGTQLPCSEGVGREGFEPP